MVCARAETEKGREGARVFVCVCGRGSERDQEEREKDKRGKAHTQPKRDQMCGEARARAANSSNCSLYHAAVQHMACWWGSGAAARAATRVLVSACRLVLRAGEGGRLKMGLHDEKHSSHVWRQVSNLNSPWR